MQDINNKIFTPFEINDSFDTPFADIDPDSQYYTNAHQNGNPNCDYYFEDKFRSKLDKIYESQLSLFYHNIKSIYKHYDELGLYLNSLDFKYSLIGLSDTWLDDNKEEFMISMVIPVSIDIEKIKRRWCLTSYSKWYTIYIVQWPWLFWQWNDVFNDHIADVINVIQKE